MIVKNKAVYKISVSALFAALICVAVVVFPVPLPTGGYFNFGDCFIIVAALCIGPLWGGLAAVGEVVMIAGYFLFEIFYYGFAGAAADVLGNAIQGACGMVSGSLVFNILSKTGVTSKLF